MLVDLGDYLTLEKRFEQGLRELVYKNGASQIHFSVLSAVVTEVTKVINLSEPPALLF